MREVPRLSEIVGRVGGPRPEDEAELADGDTLQADARGGRWLRRNRAGGVAALTTVVEGRYRAATVTGWTVVSTEPPQILVALELDGQMEGWLRESGVFGISILGWRQQLLADRFSGFAPLASPRFAGIDHFVAVTGSPLLSDCVAWADCRIVGDIETGDHRCFIGQVVDLGRGGDEDDPLIYFFNRYRRLR